MQEHSKLRQVKLNAKVGSLTFPIGTPGTLAIELKNLLLKNKDVFTHHSSKNETKTWECIEYMPVLQDDTTEKVVEALICAEKFQAEAKEHLKLYKEFLERKIKNLPIKKFPLLKAEAKMKMNDELKEKINEKHPRIYVTFHSSWDTNYESIMRNGFLCQGHDNPDIGLNFEQMHGSLYGNGVYSAIDPNKASEYAQKTKDGIFKTIVCLIIVAPCKLQTYSDPDEYWNDIRLKLPDDNVVKNCIFAQQIVVPPTMIDSSIVPLGLATFKYTGNYVCDTYDGKYYVRKGNFFGAINLSPNLYAIGIKPSLMNKLNCRKETYAARPFVGMVLPLLPNKDDRTSLGKNLWPVFHRFSELNEEIQVTGHVYGSCSLSKFVVGGGGTTITDTFVSKYVNIKSSLSEASTLTSALISILDKFENKCRSEGIRYPIVIYIVLHRTCPILSSEKVVIDGMTNVFRHLQLSVRIINLAKEESNNEKKLQLALDCKYRFETNDLQPFKSHYTVELERLTDVMSKVEAALLKNITTHYPVTIPERYRVHNSGFTDFVNRSPLYTSLVPEREAQIVFYSGKVLPAYVWTSDLQPIEIYHVTMKKQPRAYLQDLCETLKSIPRLLSQVYLSLISNNFSKEGAMTLHTLLEINIPHDLEEYGFSQQEAAGIVQAHNNLRHALARRMNDFKAIFKQLDIGRDSLGKLDQLKFTTSILKRATTISLNDAIGQSWTMKNLRFQDGQPPRTLHELMELVPQCSVKFPCFQFIFDRPTAVDPYCLRALQFEDKNKTKCIKLFMRTMQFGTAFAHLKGGRVIASCPVPMLGDEENIVNADWLQSKLFKAFYGYLFTRNPLSFTVQYHAMILISFSRLMEELAFSCAEINADYRKVHVLYRLILTIRGCFRKDPRFLVILNNIRNKSHNILEQLSDKHGVHTMSQIMGAFVLEEAECISEKKIVNGLRAAIEETIYRSARIGGKSGNGGNLPLRLKKAMKLDNKNDSCSYSKEKLFKEATRYFSKAYTNCSPLALMYTLPLLKILRENKCTASNESLLHERIFEMFHERSARVNVFFAQTYPVMKIPFQNLCKAKESGMKDKIEIARKEVQNNKRDLLSALWLQAVRYDSNKKRLEAKIDLNDPVKFIKSVALWSKQQLEIERKHQEMLQQGLNMRAIFRKKRQMARQVKGEEFFQYHKHPVIFRLNELPLLAEYMGEAIYSFQLCEFYRGWGLLFGRCCYPNCPHFLKLQGSRGGFDRKYPDKSKASKNKKDNIWGEYIHLLDELSQLKEHQKQKGMKTSTLNEQIEANSKLLDTTKEKIRIMTGGKVTTIHLKRMAMLERLVDEEQSSGNKSSTRDTLNIPKEKSVMVLKKQLDDFLKLLREPTFNLNKQTKLYTQKEREMLLNKYIQRRLHHHLHPLSWLKGYPIHIKNLHRLAFSTLFVAGLTKADFTSKMINDFIDFQGRPVEIHQLTKELLDDLYDQVHTPGYRMSLLPDSLKEKLTPKSDNARALGISTGLKASSAFEAIYKTMEV